MGWVAQIKEYDELKRKEEDEKKQETEKAVEEYPELAASVDEIKDIRDKAEAIRMYLKQSNESLGVQNRAAEIKIRGKIFAMVKCIH